MRQLTCVQLTCVRCVVCKDHIHWMLCYGHAQSHKKFLEHWKAEGMPVGSMFEICND